MPKKRNAVSSARPWLALAVLAATAMALASCQHDARSHGAPDGGTDTDTDSDTDTEADAGQDGGPVDPCGDVVHGGNVVILTADDIAALAGVTRITGDLIVSDTSLSNVNGLESLVCVDGNVYVGNNMSWSSTCWLDGLCNLRRIGGTLTVEFNETAAHVPLPGIGLYALEEAEGGVVISANYITSLVGLGNLARIGGIGLVLDFNGMLDNPEGLTSLTTIDGDLRLVGSELRNLDGLSSLTELTGSIRMEGTSLLNDLNGLSGLTEVGGIRIVGDSSNMQTSLYGLHNIHTVHGIVELYWLESLEDLQGLSGLTTVEGDAVADDTFSIHMCNSLKDLSGLESLTGMPGVIFLVAGNNDLVSLHGVENLELIRWLSVSTNDVLDNLDGLTGLKHITGPIYYIGSNPRLHSIRGLHHLEDVGSSVTIWNNAELPTCRAQAFIDYLQSIGWDESFDLSGNGPDAGCDEEPL
jgi:hypothetical protein